MLSQHSKTLELFKDEDIAALPKLDLVHLPKWTFPQKRI